MDATIARALPRVGILGNPSDGYGGRVLACTFEDFQARVHLESADQFEILPGEDQQLVAKDWAELCGKLAASEASGLLSLFTASLQVFGGGTGRAPSPFRLTATTSIPMQMGLAGSSAIIIAALRALHDWTDRSVDPMKLAEMALRAEVDVLGITAGPQDRVVQSFEGLLDMDFDNKYGFGSVERVDPELLPPLGIAWNPEFSAPSTMTHTPLKDRWEAQDPVVVAAMTRFRELAEQGVLALRQGDHDTFRQCISANFELRVNTLAISRHDQELVDVARARNVAAKLCGSGGAVLLAPQGRDDLAKLEDDCLERSCSFLKPRWTSIIPKTAT